MALATFWLRSLWLDLPAVFSEVHLTTLIVCYVIFTWNQTIFISKIEDMPFPNQNKLPSSQLTKEIRVITLNMDHPFKTSPLPSGTIDIPANAPPKKNQQTVAIGNFVPDFLWKVILPLSFYIFPQTGGCPVSSLYYYWHFRTYW